MNAVTGWMKKQALDVADGLWTAGAAVATVLNPRALAREGLSRRSKTYAEKGWSWGKRVGAVLGFALAAAVFITQPGLLHAVEVLTTPFGAGMIFGGIGAALTLPAAGLVNIVDRLRGRDPSLTKRQEEEVETLLQARTRRAKLEKYLDSRAANGWAPALTDAVPMELYGKLSDKGKIKILNDVLDADALDGYKRRADNPEIARRITSAFNNFAQNTAILLRAEQDNLRFTPAPALAERNLLERARDAVLDQPRRVAMRGPFAKALRA